MWVWGSRQEQYRQLVSLDAVKTYLWGEECMVSLVATNECSRCFRKPPWQPLDFGADQLAVGTKVRVPPSLAHQQEVPASNAKHATTAPVCM